MLRAFPDAIRRHASQRATALAVHDFRHGRGWTYAELDAAIDGFAADLAGRIAPGDRVAVLARNSVELVVVMYAAIRCGAIFVPLNWRLSAAEIADVLENCCPAVIYCEAEFEALVTGEAAAKRLPLDRRSLTLPPCACRTRRPHKDQTVLILYTSGTTGRAKGVCLSLANMAATSHNFRRVADVQPHSGLLCDSPMFHVMGLLAITRTTLELGARLYISAAFLPTTTLARFADPDLDITHYFCVPQMVQRLRDCDGFDPQACRNLRALFVGGAPLSTAIAQPWLDDGIAVINGYGMTEAGTAIHMPVDDADSLRRRTASIGVPAPRIQVRLMTREATRAGTGEVGEIWLKGPSLAKGYWNDAEATQRAFCGGWYRTGDAARCGEDGFYDLVDRWKDMYISGGENVYPAEVETAIAELPEVAEVAVVGCPHPRWGEAGVAFLVPSPGVDLSEDDVMAHCRERLAAYKSPVRIVLTDGLPKTGSGKVKKDALRRLACISADGVS
jgi:fatty-acyl-CoA synthase